MLPVAAAVLVALLVSSALIGGKLLHASRHQPSNPLAPQPAAPHADQQPGAEPVRQPSTAPTSDRPAAAGPGPVGPVGGPVPAGFRAVDLTWVSTDQGWALGTAPCAQAPCTSIVRTLDGGQTG